MHRGKKPEEKFHKENFQAICDLLSIRDRHLAEVIVRYGYPPMWTRPNTFQTLVLTILEQQVSLASAYAAFKKLRARIGYVTPDKIMQLSDDDLRACYFSRQKMGYVRNLARAILEKEINLRLLSRLDEAEIRMTLKKVKGIGDWTVDVYLMHALRRTDLFPLGDIALVNSLREVKQLSPGLQREDLLNIAEKWRPYRTIAAMILWHAYIKKRGMRIQS